MPLAVVLLQRFEACPNYEAKGLDHEVFWGIWKQMTCATEMSIDR